MDDFITLFFPGTEVPETITPTELNIESELDDILIPIDEEHYNSSVSRGFCVIA